MGRKETCMVVNAHNGKVWFVKHANAREYRFESFAKRWALNIIINASHKNNTELFDLYM